MPNLSNEERANKSFDVSLEDQQKINLIESRMRQLYTDTQRLYL